MRKREREKERKREREGGTCLVIKSTQEKDKKK